MFDPNGVGIRNGNFIGLPYKEKEARIVLFPVPWDVTVSYGGGTAQAPQAILDASPQLDLYDPDLADAWTTGIYFQPVSEECLKRSKRLRKKAEHYIERFETGAKPEDHPNMFRNLTEINAECNEMREWVKGETARLLDDGKLVGLVGGDHSTPLGYLQALAERHEHFGVLQIDAHCDLRPAYEGFTYSHASVFYNALQIPQLQTLVQVGIRDYCDQEAQLIRESNGRVRTFFDRDLRHAQYEGTTWKTLCDEIIAALPPLVYVSFDIDGLTPAHCPHTGTPVPGGLEYNEAIYLLRCLANSGKRIIGFDVNEVGNHEWDANVGARIVYKLCNLMVSTH